MYFTFKIMPMVGAIFSIYLGYKLFILGVTGQASLSIESKSINGQLLNAAPGLFFAIGGIVVLVAVVFKSVNVGFGAGGQLDIGGIVLDCVRMNVYNFALTATATTPAATII